MNIRIWQNIYSGERFAVGLDSYGAIHGAIGPLRHREIAEAKRGNWDIDQDVTEDIKASPDSYGDVTNSIPD